MRRLLAVCLVSSLVLTTVLGIAIAADRGNKPAKYTIEQIMENAHKSGLLKKVVSGQASQQDKMTLLDNYLSLVENTPPKGDLRSWHNLAGRATLAAAKVAVGRQGATAELKAAVNCKACHKLHKK